MKNDKKKKMQILLKIMKRLYPAKMKPPARGSGPVKVDDDQPPWK